MVTAAIEQLLELPGLSPPHALQSLHSHPFVSKVFGLQRVRLGSNKLESAGRWAFMSIIVDKIAFVAYICLLFIYHS
jgi:hypothetical protein